MLLTCAINDIIYRLLVSSKIRSRHEPSDLMRLDGKRPGSMTIVAWSRGKLLVLLHGREGSSWYCFMVEREAPGLGCNLFKIILHLQKSVWKLVNQCSSSKGRGCEDV